MWFRLAWTALASSLEYRKDRHALCTTTYVLANIFLQSNDSLSYFIN